MLRLLDFRTTGPNAFVPLEYFKFERVPGMVDLDINLGLSRLNTCCDAIGPLTSRRLDMVVECGLPMVETIVHCFQDAGP